MATPGAFLWSLSTSSCVAAIRLAEMGINATLCGAWSKIGEMAATGLGQSDREIIDSTKNYWGYQEEFLLRAGDLTGLNPDPKVARKRQIYFSMPVAQQILREWLDRYPERTIVNGKQKGKITWRTSAPLEDVIMNGNVIEQVKAGGTTYDCWNAFDGSDENDLAKAAGMPMRLGRESRALTGELAAGMTDVGTWRWSAIDPQTGQRSKLVLPRPRTGLHDGDSCIMAYNTRTIITDADDRQPFADMVVPGYDPDRYAAKQLPLAITKGRTTIPGGFDDILQPPTPRRTWDMNSDGVPFGNNSVGEMYAWHNATFAERKKMWEDYVCRTAGLFKAICSDPRWEAALPLMVADTKRYGMDPSLWQDSIVPGWPPMMYIRESFRLRGEYTITERDVYAPARPVPEPIATYAYHMDAHPTQQYADEDGFYTVEGNVNIHRGTGVGLLMPWGAIKPPKGRCKNLQVGRGISGTRIGRIKMRIEFSQMKIADAAAIAMGVSELNGQRSNEIDYQSQFRPALLAAGAVINHTS